MNQYETLNTIFVKDIISLRKLYFLINKWLYNDIDKFLSDTIKTIELSRKTRNSRLSSMNCLSTELERMAELEG